MAHLVKDFFTGSLIVAAGLAGSFIILVVLLVLWVLFHILGAFLLIFLWVFLFFTALWFIGFIYRKYGQKE